MTIPKTSSISIFVIATNAYVEYALNLIRSSTRWADAETPLQFLLLTDSDIDVQQFALQGKPISVSPFQIPSPKRH
jgi:hypothetical protein